MAKVRFQIQFKPKYFSSSLKNAEAVFTLDNYNQMKYNSSCLPYLNLLCLGYLFFTLHLPSGLFANDAAEEVQFEDLERCRQYCKRFVAERQE